MEPTPPQQGTPLPPGEHGQQSLSSPPCLPYRDVTAETIEDAYVQFIVYCNPGLPPKPDIETLRESFRNPPRSGGKAFDAFVIYQLVRQFYQKEIKTWAELTMKLGVEPPDPNKEESTQKIAQYGVRLKKWMNSMHVKAFFEYLMNIPNEYWTQIPTDQDPTAIPMRDGVAIEDDMALRALLPHIRRKKGRKRPGEDDNLLTPSQQRPRLSPMSAIDDPRHTHPGHNMWPPPGEPRSAIPSWGDGDHSQGPAFRWPQSAVTPTARGGFWDDANEPQSATTPSGKKPTQRRGVKNVSSAWKTGGPESSGKTRGRPPINRTPIEGPSFSNVQWPTPQQPMSATSHFSQMPPAPPHSAPAPVPPMEATAQAPSMPMPSANAPLAPPTYPSYSPIASAMPRRKESDPARPPRPVITLQVPEQPSADIRLTTPPGLHPGPQGPAGPPRGTSVATGNTAASSMPDQYVDIDSSTEPHSKSGAWNTWTNEALDAYNEGQEPPAPSNPRQNSTSNASTSGPNNATSASSTTSNANAKFNAERNAPLPDFYFENLEDRTNVDTIMSYFIQAAYDAEWCNADGTPAQRATLDEATAIVNIALQTMYKSATSPQVFLINLAALAGARHLMTKRARYVRRGGDDKYKYYSFEWEYRFGHVQGTYSMLHKVPRSMWPMEEMPAMVGGEKEGVEVGEEEKKRMSAADWQKKYENLLKETERRNKEMWELRTRVMGWGRGA